MHSISAAPVRKVLIPLSLHAIYVLSLKSGYSILLKDSKMIIPIGSRDSN
jgi:hypothetical protein